MTSELKSQDDGKQTLTIKADWLEVAADYEDLLTEFDRVALPGFRPGKAPRAIIEQRFRQKIRDDFAARCGRRLARQALGERNLRAAGPINVTRIQFEPRREFAFDAEFVPLPKLELPDYAAVPLQGTSGAERRDEISEWLLANTRGDPPTALVQQEVKSPAGSEEWKAAARRVKLTLILEEIAEREGITTGQHDLDARIGNTAADHGLRAAELRRQLGEDGLRRLQSLLRVEQTLNYLLSQRIVVPQHQPDPVEIHLDLTPPSELKGRT